MAYHRINLPQNILARPMGHYHREEWKKNIVKNIDI